MSQSNSQDSGGKGLRIALGAVVGLFALFGIVYGVDYALTKGDVPRGTSVGGVEIGGMEPAAAQELLESELGGNVDKPVEVSAAERTATLVPATAGLSIDFAETVAQIGTEPANPFLRLEGLVSTREAEIVSRVDDTALAPELERLHGELTAEPADGAVSLIDGRVDATAPIYGQDIDPAQLRERVTADWLDPDGVEVEAEVTPPAIDDDVVAKAVEGDAAAAVSGPLTVHGRDDIDGVIEPARMGEVVTFVPVDGELKTEINTEAAQGILDETLAETESAKQNARITFSGGGRQVTPSVDGVQIDWEATLDGFEDRVLASGEAREWDATYEDDPATFTTDMAQTATFDQTVGEFTTSGYSAASGVNIAKVAAVVNGAIVAPGDTFSLNGYTGPRGAAQGYVESGIIINGRAGEAVGGGISQFATTLYNAAYFAGMEDVAHTPHSYYISRYPAGREATVFEGSIDLQFRNNSQYPVRLETAVGGGNVTVRLTGVKTVQVESVNGGRWAATQPREQRVSGSDCIPSGGAPGFTTSDTRIIRDLSGNEISRETQTTVYDPQPIVRCA
ncbi:MAG: VanW family protein [Corynebacterium sp.]|uniref:VanW family protein n=1 Tax=Corynebacterium sp. TaxID=1720 RepID=UPI0026DF84ED|nr:VanW family protein [Corynebacterium sp.]MDO5670891.1 VanW family protein [Corynebacterium sp.]